ncbi:MAG TPA: NAD(P)/FAD-dependent oxidoreductase [Trebonia sp.]|jgi:kynurenine 3-monooxygenase|nr:NAD(P)/FAD-dependent oxidoreductase [Trebonia sp.]
MTEPGVAIVGAGLAGCLLATLLARRGTDVTVYERRDDPRLAAPERGRSINLAISARGLEALDEVGLRELSLSRALPMHGRMVHGPAGERGFRPYSAGGTHAINSISRAELNLALLEVAERTPGVRIEFGHRLGELDMATGALRFENPEGVPGGWGGGERGRRRTARAGVVLACDGAYSAARRSVTFRPGFTFSQDYLEHGYKELTVPARDGDFALDPDALHIWPRGSSMMIALPNLDRSFTCTLFWTADEFAALRTPQEIVAYFREHYADVVDLIPDLADDFLYNPVGSLATIRCWPWVHQGAGCTLALVGDAAHAIVPFYGQGANCAFEDCVEIDVCLAETGGDWTAALDCYQRRRKTNCDAIADMALDNFIEMRDRVNSPVFRATTAARHALERRLPGRYVSRYELVSFSTVPYAQIPGRIRRQDRLTALAAAGALGLAGAGLAGARLLLGRGSGQGRSQ